MTVYYYKATSQPIELGDRVEMTDGQRGEIIMLYLGPDGVRADVTHDGGGIISSHDLRTLRYLGPEQELAEAREQIAEMIPDPIRQAALGYAIQANGPWTNGPIQEWLAHVNTLADVFARHLAGQPLELREPQAAGGDDG